MVVDGNVHVQNWWNENNMEDWIISRKKFFHNGGPSSSVFPHFGCRSVILTRMLSGVSSIELQFIGRKVFLFVETDVGCFSFEKDQNPLQILTL